MHLQTEVPDFKINRQLNTSPARTRRSDNKKDILPKGVFKRNLFGENEESQSPVFNKHLTEHPVQPFLIDPAIQSIKCNDFSYKTQYLEKEGTLCLYNLDLISIKFKIVKEYILQI